MKKVFVCSPYRGDIEKNRNAALRYCRTLSSYGWVPVAPHLYFPQFMDEKSAFMRHAAIDMGIDLMKSCDEVQVFGFNITEGMQKEINKALELHIPVSFFDTEMDPVPLIALRLNDGLSEATKAVILRVLERR